MFSQVVIFAVIIHKCSSITPKCSVKRNGTYDRCHHLFRTMQLYCDYTNLTRLPDPDDTDKILAQTHPRRTREIYLNNSCVDVLERAVLSRYSYLLVLNCAENDLTTIDARLFSGNQNLTKLLLTWNRISFVHDDAFEGLTHLQTLGLGRNRLVRVNEKVFYPLRNLLTLDLSYNRLQSLDHKAFLRLQNLKVLRLMGNHLHEINYFHFSTMVELRILNLGSNSIANLPDNIFNSNSHIEVIDLSFNNLTCISDELFEDLKHLFSLRLNGNNLKTPRQMWFQNVWSEKKLKGSENLLSHNPWKCDCTLHRYMNFLQGVVTEERWKKILDVQCFSPEKYREQNLSALSPTLFADCLVGPTPTCDGVQYTPFPHQHVSEPHDYGDDDDVVPDDNVKPLDDSSRKKQDDPSDDLNDPDDGSHVKDNSYKISATKLPTPGDLRQQKKPAETDPEEDKWKYIAIGVSGLFVACICGFIASRYKCTKRKTKKKQNSDDETTAMNSSSTSNNIQTRVDTRLLPHQNVEESRARLPAIPFSPDVENHPNGNSRVRFYSGREEQLLGLHHCDTEEFPPRIAFSLGAEELPQMSAMQNNLEEPLIDHGARRIDMGRPRDRDSGCSVGFSFDPIPFSPRYRVVNNRRGDHEAVDLLRKNHPVPYLPQHPPSHEIYYSIPPSMVPDPSFTKGPRNEISAPQLVHSV